MPGAGTKHTLFMDIVGFSKLSGQEQKARIEALEALIAATPEYQNVDDGALTVLPTGDGYALVFDHLESPARCAVAVARGIRQMPDDTRIPLRTGIHAGPAYDRTALNDAVNLVGSGANIAQRVMDLGDDRHILVSEAAREQAYQHDNDWARSFTEADDARLNDLGVLTVKHGEEVHVHNLYAGDFGNAEAPSKAREQLAARLKAARDAVRRIHVRDVGDGKVEVSLQGEEDAGRIHTADLPDLLDDDERGEFAWYLEEYLSFPYGAERERAERVERLMEEWGGRLRHALFGEGRGAEILARALDDGLAKRELSIESDDARFLARPWELLHDQRLRYFAFGFRGLYRTLGASTTTTDIPPETGEPFRILLVVCRPHGERDVPHGTVARPMLDALRPLRPRIELDVLRPPTFDALLETLQSRRYDLVHFDGHGAFPAARRGPRFMSLGAPEGRLVFENADGEPDPVGADRLQEITQRSHVPLWVLNACQSAMVGEDDAIASVASRLTQAGARAVVAMSHSIYKEAAGIFVGAFYAALARHASMSEAVAEGRRALHANQSRDSVVGKLSLSDWVVPTLYQQAETVTPIPATTTAPPVADDPRNVVRERVERVCPKGYYGFIGRDHDIQRIERALYQQDRHVVTLNGVGGTGKTELANGFARWYSETGGCPGGVFRAEFSDGTDFARVMASVFGYGTDHSMLSDEKQWEALVGHLRENACLLVWDNFETVDGYAAGAEEPAQLVQPATSEERKRFVRLVRELRGGPTRVLITTRKPDERWLGAPPQKLEIGGLAEWDRIPLAKSILDTVEKAPEDFGDDPEFWRLLGMLGGHPRSMEVVLPLLERRAPANLIAALEHETREGNGMEDASLEVAFHALSEESRRHLPFLGLFVSRVHCAVLANFVHSDDSQQEAYEKLLGHAPDADGWERILDEAAGHGLVRHIGGVQYALHPTLPVFLRRQLRDEIGDEGAETLDTEFTRFYGAFAMHYYGRVKRVDPEAIGAIEGEEANLLRALSLVLGSRSAWAEAVEIARAVAAGFLHRGRGPERQALLARALGAVGTDPPEDDDRARTFWRYLVCEGALDALNRASYIEAERLCLRVLDTLDESEGSSDERNVAAMYQNLGATALSHHDYGRAQHWLRKALPVFERLHMAIHTAMVSNHLGIAACRQHDYDGAKAWIQKALATGEGLGLEHECATGYQNMGIVACEQGDYDGARMWFGKALAIYRRLGLEAGAAASCQGLGVAALESDDFDGAETWLRKAVSAAERLGLAMDSGTGYHSLGVVAQARGDYDGAKAWFRRALNVRECLGQELLGATDCYHLGAVAQLQRDFPAAKVWYYKALVVFEELGALLEIATTRYALGLLQSRQEGDPEAVSEFARGFRSVVDLHMPIRGQLASILERMFGEMGEGAFVAAWRAALPDDEELLAALLAAFHAREANSE